MEPVLGQLMLWGGNFAPNGWFYCNGQLLPIRQYTALFSILGTYYGGDGVTTFALPDLRGRAACHTSDGSVREQITLGESFGQESYNMTTAQMPAHTHVVSGTVGIGCNDTDSEDSESPENAYFRSMPTEFYADSGTDDMGPSTVKLTISAAGGNAPIPNVQPALGLSYCIAWQGDFPQRP